MSFLYYRITEAGLRTGYVLVEAEVGEAVGPRARRLRARPHALGSRHKGREAGKA
jgi:hypothetical protein